MPDSEEYKFWHRYATGRLIATVFAVREDSTIDANQYHDHAGVIIMGLMNFSDPSKSQLRNPPTIGDILRIAPGMFGIRLSNLDNAIREAQSTMQKIAGMTDEEVRAANVALAEWRKKLQPHIDASKVSR